MQFHTLVAKTKQKHARRVGRGGKRGTFSGRGTKGQRARAGARIRPAEREFLKTIPKLRGYKFKSFRRRPAAVSVFSVARVFKEGETVSPRSLHERGLIKKQNGMLPAVKILGASASPKKFIFKDVLLAGSAPAGSAAPNEAALRSRS